MSNSRKKRKQKSREKRLAALAEEPLADQEMEMIDDEEAEGIAMSAQEIIDAPVVDLTEDEGKELATKPHLGLDMMVPFGGAQTWRELEAFDDVRAAAAGAKRTASELVGMVQNVVADDSTGPPEKASRLGALAAGFAPRAEVNTQDNKAKDPGTIEVIMDKLGLKQITKREAGASFIASDFADVPDKAKPSTWKLRLAEGSSGNFTVAQVARAITAMQPSGFRGQRVQLGSSKSSVTGKISSAIGKIKGASDTQKSELRERLAKVKSTGFQVFKDAQGNSRWFGWVSNKWRDRDVMAHPGGEIISEEAHKEFVDWVWEEKDSRMPQLWLWHTPGTAAEKRADWLDYADGFLLASGSLTQKEAAMFDRLASKYDLAMSHGFFKIGYDKKNGIISKYRGFEDSVLPREFVANEWTDFATLQEAKDMGFTEETRGYMVDALGEEKVVELESSTKESADALKALGVEFKEAETPEAETAKAEPEVEVEVETEELEAEPAKAIDVKVIAEALGLTQLSDVIESITENVKGQGDAIEEIKAVVVQLTKSDDEKVAETLTPRMNKAEFVPSWLRLSEAKETEVSEEKETEIKEGEGAGWVNDAMGQYADPKAQVPLS